MKTTYRSSVNETLDMQNLQTCTTCRAKSPIQKLQFFHTWPRVCFVFCFSCDRLPGIWILWYNVYIRIFQLFWFGYPFLLSSVHKRQKSQRSSVLLNITGDFLCLLMLFLSLLGFICKNECGGKKKSSFATLMRDCPLQNSYKEKAH